MARALLLLVVTVLLINPVHSQYLKPFGNLDWQDGFTTTVQKMLSLPNIEHSEVKLFASKIEGLTSDTSSIDQLPDRLLHGDNASLLLPFRPPYKIQTFVEAATGRTFSYVEGCTFQVAVYPVNICDVPFTLTAQFECNPGLLLHRPANALLTREKQIVPLVLHSVALSSTSDALKHRADAISNILAERYYGGKTAGGIVKDSEGTMLTVEPSVHRYSIQYGALYGSAYIRRLKQAYEQHEASLALREAKGKADQAAGL